MILMVAGGHGSNAVVVAWTQKTMLRPRVKRAADVALVNAVGNISQVFSSYLYQDDSAPRYILTAITFRLVLQKGNRDLDRGTKQLIAQACMIVKRSFREWKWGLLTRTQ
ncbi:MFS transporter [Neofusicoccum parvum]|uniref:MFS transporter n=1 Tax=Neofusicoccum parvum TaxID=310453 RepID=A0ACB5RVH9_9PEZI|nr:MFS transporter [Neofusicoccum parvum]